MRPEFRPRRLCGRGPVAKRVPTVQRRSAARNGAGLDRSRSSPSECVAVPDQRRHSASKTRVNALVSTSFRAAPRPGHVTARIFHSRAPGSTKGKPPGGDPAAPVRRRSCRGAGSATAGARLGYMVITGVVRQGVPCPACPYRIGAGPSGAFRRRRVLHGRGTRRGPARPSD